MLQSVNHRSGCFIGPGDLSADFGRAGKWAEPEIWQAIMDAGRRIKAAGKSAGFLSGVEKECREVLAAGFGCASPAGRAPPALRYFECLAMKSRTARLKTSGCSQ